MALSVILDFSWAHFLFFIYGIYWNLKHWISTIIYEFTGRKKNRRTSKMLLSIIKNHGNILCMCVFVCWEKEFTMFLLLRIIAGKLCKIRNLLINLVNYCNWIGKKDEIGATFCLNWIVIELYPFLHSYIPMYIYAIQK